VRRRAARLPQSVVQQHPIGQFGEKVVLCQIRNPERHCARRTDVVKYDHGTNYMPAPVMNGSCRVFDVERTAIAAARSLQLRLPLYLTATASGALR
jgi:hypothetical protein